MGDGQHSFNSSDGKCAKCGAAYVDAHTVCRPTLSQKDWDNVGFSDAGRKRFAAMMTCDSRDGGAAEREAFAASRGSAAEETIERTIWVGVTAAGFTGRFTLPETHLHELVRWLAERAGGREKQPNVRMSDGGHETPDLK